MDIASRFRTTATPSLDQLRAGQSSVVQPITDSPKSLIDRIREQQSFFSTVDSLPNDGQLAAIDAFRRSGASLIPRTSFVQKQPITSNIENIVEVTERDDPVEELETQAIQQAAPSFVRVSRGSADRDRSDDASSPLSSNLSEGERAFLGQVERTQKTLNQVDSAFEAAEGREPKNIFEGAFDRFAKKDDFDRSVIFTTPLGNFTTDDAESLAENVSTNFIKGLAASVLGPAAGIVVNTGASILKGESAEKIAKRTLESGITTALSFTPVGPFAPVLVAGVKTGAEIADSDFEGFGVTNFVAGLTGNLTGGMIGTKVPDQTQQQSVFESQMDEAFMGIGSPDETAPEPEGSIFIRDHKDDWGLTAPEDQTPLNEIRNQIKRAREQAETDMFTLSTRDPFVGGRTFQEQATLFGEPSALRFFERESDAVDFGGRYEGAATRRELERQELERQRQRREDAREAARQRAADAAAKKAADAEKAAQEARANEIKGLIEKGDRLTNPRQFVQVSTTDEDGNVMANISVPIATAREMQRKGLLIGDPKKKITGASKLTFTNDSSKAVNSELDAGGGGFRTSRGGFSVGSRRGFGPTGAPDTGRSPSVF